MFVNIHFPLLTKCLCLPDEMASRAGFGPSATVWTGDPDIDYEEEW